MSRASSKQTGKGSSAAKSKKALSTKSASKPQAKPKVASKLKSKSKPKTTAKAKVITKAKSKVKAKTKVEAKPKAKVTTKAKPKSKVAAKPKAKAKAKVTAKAKPKPKPKPKSKVTAKPKAKPKAKPAAKSKVAISKAKLKSQVGAKKSAVSKKVSPGKKVASKKASRGSMDNEALFVRPDKRRAGRKSGKPAAVKPVLRIDKSPALKNQSVDPTQIYLREIGYQSLLTAKEELKLARLVQRNNKKALHRMIECNLRLVVKISRYYCNRGLEFLDLVAEGNVGLITAVKKFDPARKLRFSTYATWWIRQTIERAIMNQSRTVRLPVHVIKEMNIYLRAGQALSSKLSKDATADDIANMIDKPVAEIRRLLDLSASQTSLDTPVGEEGARTLQDNLPCQNNIDPATLMGEEDLCSHLDKCLQSLGDMQREIIMRRYGVCGKRRDTLEKIAKDTGLTREKVRTIQLDGIKKLRDLVGDDSFFLDDS